MNNRRFFLFTALGVVCFWGLYLFASHQGWFDPSPLVVNRHVAEPDEPRYVDQPTLSQALNIDIEDMVKVGGVMRPKRDLAGKEPKLDLDGIRAGYLESRSKVGYAPTVAPGDSPAAAQLQKDLADEATRALAMSPLFRPKEFDRDEYLKDKQAYLNLTRPGRVNSALEPGKGVPQIIAAVPNYQEILQGESVILKVESEAGMPVTFHTQQLGEFENRLKTITVEASEQGLAEVKYRAVTGVRGLVTVLAASPVRSGRLKFIIEVKLP